MPEFSIVDLKKEDFSVSSWSGGTTSQLAIEPENAEYKDRDFLCDLSTAVYLEILKFILIFFQTRISQNVLLICHDVLTFL